MLSYISAILSSFPIHGCVASDLRVFVHDVIYVRTFGARLCVHYVIAARPIYYGDVLFIS